MKKILTYFLIFTIVLVQCPYEARAAVSSSAGGNSAALTPFQSEFYRTDLITGTASLSIPIAVAPGRAGIQPNIGLSYSSSAGNSWCGVGWNLDLGAIERDTRGGIPQYDNSDTFIASVSGASMKLVNIGGQEYRARIDSGFMKFLYQQSGDYWQVWDKNGTKYRFGYNADSKISTPQGTIKWAFDEVLDTNGNYMSISYIKDQGQIYPAKIEYTGNKNTGYFPRHTVEFILETRNDHASSYRSGEKIITAKRLKEIHVKVSGQWARRYVFDYTYSPDTSRSLITSATEYGQDGLSALPSIKTFTYSVKGNELLPEKVFIEPPIGQFEPPLAPIGDNLWNVCILNQDTGGNNYGPVPPFSSGTVYTQPSYNAGVWWQIDADGDIHYGGPRDTYICAWTYLYVKQAKTISLSYYNEVDTSAGFYLRNADGTSLRTVNRNSIPLNAGYNIFYLTSYNENQGYRLEMDGAIAGQVDLMNSSPISPQPEFDLLPIMGDFNGDGRVDIGRYYRNTGIWEVALAQKDDFSSYSIWISDFGAIDIIEPIISDFNNDGLTDIGTYNKENGSWHIALSDGAQFHDQGGWAYDFGRAWACSAFVGDFNGDTLIDVGTYNQEHGHWAIALNSGGNFVPIAQYWAQAYGQSREYNPIVDDFNGDGLTDIGIHHKTNGSVSVALCNGSAFISSGNWLLGFAPGKTILTGDFNNDGLTDIGSFDKQSGQWTTAFSSGSGFQAEGVWLDNFGQGQYITAYTGDFNGDGVNNAGIFNWEIGSWAQIPATESPSDLLLEFSNGLGGKTAITYQPSTAYDNTGSDNLSDLPFPIQTVSSVSIEDGLGNPPNTINYNYEGGLFDFQEKEFIGFGRVTVIDAQNSISETTYNQDKVDGLYIYKGMPVTQEIKQDLGSGLIALYQRKTYSYDYTTPYPGLNYSPLLIQEENLSYDGMQAPKTARVNYQYDIYGNVTVVGSSGDTTIAGDERKQQTEYTYNTGSWIMNRPAHAWLEDANGQKVSENWHYYDGHSNYTDAPTLGNLTKEESWLDTGGNPSALYTYDNYGNVLTASDARGNTTTTIYEDTYHTFPKTITNTLGHTIQYTYAPKTGQILSTTDPNGQTTRNEYDVLGRLIKVFGPNDDAAHPGVWYEYDLASRPLKITTYARSEYNTNDSNKIQISYAFYDGLGRLIQTKSQAEDSTEQIVSNVVTFNSQGKVKEKYLPYYITAGTQTEAAAYSSPNYSGAKVSFLYDSLGRLIQTTTLNESGQPIHSTVTYERWTKTAIDANGSKTKYTSDAYGQLIKVEEINGPDIYTTRYAYDTQGSLISTLDDQGNAATISYDSLGRKIAMDDPDMGQWSYEYDANGNLIKQTDAKGQVLDFQYDSLNRLTCKLANSQIIVSYFYDQAAKPNCIGRLSKVVDLSGETEFFYDSLGREIKTEKTINNKLYTVNRSYDALDRLISVTYPNGKTAQYTYNSQGGIETVTTPDGSINNIDYTESDQIKLIQYSNGTQTQYAYNSNTLRLSRLQTSSSSVLQDLAYSFDNIGNVSTITDNSAQGTNTQSFQYDDLNRLVGATGQAYGSIQYAYDSLGNLVYKGALGMAYGQGAGPHAVTELTNSQTGKLTKLTYDANGNMLTKGRTQYNYDSENRLTQVETSSYGQATTITIPLSLGWNLLAIPLELSDYSIVNVLSSIAGKYDQLTRYNSATDEFESFVNDPKFNQFDTFSFGEGYLIHISQDCTLTIIGQLTNPPARGLEVGWNLIASPALEAEISTSTALNNLIQGVDYEKVAEYNGSGYTYNPTTMQPGAAYYIYALRGCVWQIPQPADEITTFAYDGDGGRVEKTVYGLGSIVDRKTIYIGSLYEEDSDGNQTCHIYLGSNKAFSINHKQSTVNTYYYHSDHLGSSNVISDNQGNQAQLLEYRPFGLTNRQEGGYNTNYRFTGKEFDSSVALSYYGARYYDPELGRFTQPDSIVQQPSNPQTLNRYSYCNNNPVNYVDPTGHFFQLIIGALIGAFVGAGIGAAIAAATDSDIGQGAIGGAIGGAFFGFVGGLSYASTFQQGLAHVWAGSASGAVGAVTTGQDVGLNALIGGASAGAAFGIGSILPQYRGTGFGGYLANVTRRSAIGALVGGGISAATGGKFSYGAKRGAITAGIAYTANESLHEAVRRVHQWNRLASRHSLASDPNGYYNQGNQDVILEARENSFNVNLSLRYSPYDAGLRTPFTTTALCFRPLVNEQVTPEVIGHAAGITAACTTGSAVVGYAVYGYTKATVSALMGGEYEIPIPRLPIGIPWNPKSAY